MQESYFLVVLTRFDYGEKQTLGGLDVLRSGEIVYQCRTLELPWKENKKRKSCIPELSTTARKRRADESPSRDYDHFIVNNVPSREYILLHKGNFYWHVEGCILPGKKHAHINNDGLLDITNTGETLQELLNLLPQEFDFIVTSSIDARKALIERSPNILLPWSRVK